MTEAEEILATAEAWWDVDRSGFRDGDRYLRNIGTAGSALNLRLGSAGVANSNDPKWLGPEGLGYVYLPGLANNYLSAPDEAALDITGDLDLRARVAFDEVSASVNYGIISKTDLSTNRSYEWRYQAGAVGFSLEVGSSGSAVTLASGLVNTPYSNGEAHWVRVTWRASDGRVQFFTAADQPSTPSSWTQLGTDKTANVGSLFSGSAALFVGSRVAATSPMAGRVYRAQVLNGIGGSTVLDVDCDALASGAATSFTATSGQTVTINRATSGRKSVAMPARSKGGRPCMLLGTDDYLECQDAAQHGVLNFYGGREVTVLAVVRWWATPTGSASIINKGDEGNTPFNGWSLRTTGGTNFEWRVGDGVLYPVRRNTISLGTLASTIGTLSTGRSMYSLYVNGSTANQSSAGVGDFRYFNSLSTLQPVRVGNRSTGGNTYGDFELFAAAIWRRALTAREITVIANAAPWGV